MRITIGIYWLNAYEPQLNYPIFQREKKHNGIIRKCTWCNNSSSCNDLWFLLCFSFCASRYIINECISSFIIAYLKPFTFTTFLLTCMYLWKTNKKIAQKTAIKFVKPIQFNLLVISKLHQTLRPNSVHIHMRKFTVMYAVKRKRWWRIVNLTFLLSKKFKTHWNVKTDTQTHRPLWK